MAPKVIKYGDTSGIESDFKQAPVGLYIGKVVELEQKKSKNDEDMVEVVWELIKDSNGKKLKTKYGRLWFYAPLDPEASWARRLKDLVTAFGLKAKGGNLASILGKEALLRLREDTDLDGEYRPNIGKVLKLEATGTSDEDEDDEDDEEEEEDSEDDLAGLSRVELKALIKEEELEINIKKSMSDDDIRELITESRPESDDEEDEDEDEEDDDDEEDEDEEPDDNYDSLSVAELRQELKDRELESKGNKVTLIARLRTDDSEEPI